jgi:sterol desaturase/sphingolipid hydroxylase (fatty acid hydroxylase superfamily)
VSLGNFGLEWLVPAALAIVIALVAFRYFRVRLICQVFSLGITLAWSFLMFSYLHDRMHIEGTWMEGHKWIGRWFIGARRLHDIHHHCIDGSGLMNKNFGIGFFLFDRLFGTFASKGARLNRPGWERAQQRWYRHVR